MRIVIKVAPLGAFGAMAFTVESQELGALKKGATGVAGAGFITLATTLSAVPSVPIASLAILLGIDRFMSECLAFTNLSETGSQQLLSAGGKRNSTWKC